MIFIYDNGESYSDHSLYFIEVDGDAEKIERLIVSARRTQNPNGKVIGRTDSIRWANEEHNTSLGSVVHPIDMFTKSDLNPDDERVAFVRTFKGNQTSVECFVLNEETFSLLNRSLLRTLVNDWRTLKRSGPALDWLVGALAKLDSYYSRPGHE